MSTGLRKTYSSKASIHSALAILSKDDEDGRLGNKNQRVKVISTKISVDQYESFNLLAEYLFKTGVVENTTPSTLLRNYITQILSSYQDDIENYRITKKLSTHDDLLQPMIMTNTQNKQNLSLDSPAPAKDKDQPEVLDRDSLTISHKNQPSSIQSTQEDERYVQIQIELQDTKRELEYMRQQQQQKAEEIGGNASSTREEKDEYFRLDLNRHMTVIHLIYRNTRNKPHAYIYLEPDKNKDINAIVPDYSFEKYKNEKAAKKLEGESTGTI
jgi:hypothetical protein